MTRSSGRPSASALSRLTMASKRPSLSPSQTLVDTPAGVREELGEQAGQLPLQTRFEPLPDASDVCSRQLVADGFEKRQIGDREISGRAATPKHREAKPGCAPPGLSREPGLSDASLAGEDDEPAVAASRVQESIIQRGQLVLAPHQDRAESPFGDHAAPPLLEDSVPRESSRTPTRRPPGRPGGSVRPDSQACLLTSWWSARTSAPSRGSATPRRAPPGAGISALARPLSSLSATARPAGCWWQSVPGC